MCGCLSRCELQWNIDPQLQSNFDPTLSLYSDNKNKFNGSFFNCNYTPKGVIFRLHFTDKWIEAKKVKEQII